MDSVQIEKLQAINKYNKSQLINNLFLYCLTAMTSILLCSSPFWLPSLISSIKVFLFVSIPNIGVHFANPKCLFIVCNIIIVFLIGESKFGGTNSSPADTEIYEEYVKRSASLRRQRRTPKEKDSTKLELELELALVEESEKRVVIVEEEKEAEEDVGGEEEEKQVENNIHQVEEEENGKEEEEDEELGLPVEELNKKVEDFIAKINNQRKLEARLLVCGRR